MRPGTKNAAGKAWPAVPPACSAAQAMANRSARAAAALLPSPACDSRDAIACRSLSAPT